MSKRIVIRADASEQIGAGHVMRCLALADELRQRGAEVTFVAREMLPVLAQRIRDAGHALHLLPPPRNPGRNQGFTYAHWLSEEAETDARQTLDVMRGLGEVDWLVVDHYGIDACWERIARDGTERLMVIDDMADRPHDCDLLLDQTPGRTAGTYTRLLSQGSLALCGAEYALIRKGIRIARKKALKRRESYDGVRNILVHFGARDITEKFVSSISMHGREEQDFEKIIILGLDGKSTKRVTFLRYINKIEKILIDADVAIGAGGVSALERACLGIPQMLYTINLNQKYVTEGLSKEGCALRMESLEFEKARRKLQIMSPKAVYEKMSESGASTVRGNGALLISIVMLPRQSRDGRMIWLKPFEMEDMDMLFTLQKQEGVRKYFFNPETPTYDEHIVWFNSFMHNPYKMGWIIMLERKKVGMIRTEFLSSGKYEISILVSPSYQGLGIGRASLSYAKYILQGEKIVANIHINNTPSIKIFEKENFSRTGKIYKNFVEMECRKSQQ